MQLEIICDIALGDVNDIANESYMTPQVAVRYQLPKEDDYKCAPYAREFEVWNQISNRALNAAKASPRVVWGFPRKASTIFDRGVSLCKSQTRWIESARKSRHPWRRSLTELCLVVSFLRGEVVCRLGLETVAVLTLNR